MFTSMSPVLNPTFQKNFAAANFHDLGEVMLRERSAIRLTAQISFLAYLNRPVFGRTCLSLASYPTESRSGRAVFYGDA